eukprot:GDKJ01010358.1.p1 GENE.GDKJ01010358.1~~GDKJ01010358.1.p1  ORF type:complete len:401 (+),score=94.44 GDKJ01010358.1:29-1231(+)
MDEEYATFISITGADHTAAKHFLDMSSGNMEQAISLFFEHGSPPTASTSDLPTKRAPVSSVSDSSSFDDQDVRAPMNVHKVEQMLGTADFLPPAAPLIRKKPKVFSEYSALGEAFMAGAKLSSNLPFQECMNLAVSEKRWILMHIHEESSFDSLCLSRDVWPSETVKDILNDSFILWMRPDYHPEVRGLLSKYPQIQDAPFVAIIDPRTGRVAKKFNNLKSILDEGDFAAAMFDFLDRNNLRAPNVNPVKLSNAIQSASTSNTNISTSLEKNDVNRVYESNLEQIEKPLPSVAVAEKASNTPVACVPAAVDALKSSCSPNSVMRLTLLDGRKVAVHIAKSTKIIDFVEFASRLNGWEMADDFDVCQVGVGSGVEGLKLRGDELVGDCDLNGVNVMCYKRS